MPSAQEALASVSATVAHELFHLVQFSYFPADGAAALPAPLILEGTAAALETRVAPELDDLVCGRADGRGGAPSQPRLRVLRSLPNVERQARVA